MRLSNTPPKGAGKAQGVTKTERLLKHIAGMGSDRNMNPIGIRTMALSEATGVPAKSIQALLDPHIKSGALVVCKITGANGRQEREYRTGPGVPPPEFKPLSTKPGWPWPQRMKTADTRPAPAVSTPAPAASEIEPPVFLSKTTQPEVVAPSKKTPAAGDAPHPPAVEPAVIARATPGPTPRATLKKEPAAVKAPAGDVFRIQLDDDGTLLLADEDGVMELDIERTLRLGDFLHATQGVWRP